MHGDGNEATARRPGTIAETALPTAGHPEADEAVDAAAVGRRRTVCLRGVAWTVRLVRRGHDRRSEFDLVFDSPEVVRRVRHYPADWHTLGDHALLALSERR